MKALSRYNKEKAASLRRSGHSLGEISALLKIAKSTASLWLRDVELGALARGRLTNRILTGRDKAASMKREKRLIDEKAGEDSALKVVKSIKRNIAHNKLYCALLYWCEGGKRDGEGIRFINSDPVLIKTFLALIRKSYNIDEKKLRALMHLHGYHNEEFQKKFWSGITGIPKSQFNKTFLKKSTGKRLKEDYAGCLAVSYHDVKIAREMKAIYKVFSA